jgi:hypothetical protein
MENITLITAIAGLVFGLLRAILGVMNTWKAFDRDRIRLRVKPVFFIRTDGVVQMGGYRLVITNLSFFPITVKQVGFITKDPNVLSSFFRPIDCTLPQRMEARSAFTASIPEPDGESFLGIRAAYADTACGKRFTGSCEEFLSELRKRHAPRSPS